MRVGYTLTEFMFTLTLISIIATLSYRIGAKSQNVLQDRLHELNDISHSRFDGVIGFETYQPLQCALWVPSGSVSSPVVIRDLEEARDTKSALRTP